MSQLDDDLERQFIAAALTGILAAQRTKPDYKLVCREAIEAGFRLAIALQKDRRRLRALVAKPRPRTRRT